MNISKKSKRVSENTRMFSVVLPPQINNNDVFINEMSKYIGMINAAYLWYKGAHHVSRGTSFIADHAMLYSDFYEALDKDYDAAVEKAIGISNDQQFGCPVKNTSIALQVLQLYPSPVSLTSLSMAATALQIEKDLISLTSSVFHTLEKSGSLSLGLNDFLMSFASAHESHVYKLQQRIKSTIEE
jgi:DNA-binding ferritin-like protein